MPTRVRINGADSIRSLESQIILHPEDRTKNLMHGIGEIKDALDWILKRNSTAEAFIPLKLRQDTARRNVWVPKTGIINPKINFRGIYQPLTTRQERLGLGRAADLPVVFNFSIHDLAGNLYTAGKIREMIRERAILELQELLQRVDTELSGAIEVINQKYPDGKNTWKLVHQTQRAKILGIMSRI